VKGKKMNNQNTSNLMYEKKYESYLKQTKKIVQMVVSVYNESNKDINLNCFSVTKQINLNITDGFCLDQVYNCLGDLNSETDYQFTELLQNLETNLEGFLHYTEETNYDICKNVLKLVWGGSK
jgi:hypothetical protein